MPLRLSAPFAPSGDQPNAIENLLEGLRSDLRFQGLLGVTGSGKTFTIANVISRTNLPTLILSHNKTLAAQLYEELRRFFPDNAVHYFVSYYDYYQPEAYIPQTDTYIEKDSKINEELDRLRHATVQAVLSRQDVIVVASVSAIYNIGSPDYYTALSMTLAPKQRITHRELLERLTDLQYSRNDTDLLPGTFRVRGETISVAAPTGDTVFLIKLGREKIETIKQRGVALNDPERPAVDARIFPAKFWLTPPNTIPLALTNIEAELAQRLTELKQHNRLLEIQRLKHRVLEDLAMMRETGYCHGIENYSRHLEFRESGSAPFTLLDYFNRAYGKNKFLTVLDESHQTVPQIRGMSRGDRSRKETLVQYGFRLPSAVDNRPLDFNEFSKRIGQTIFLSATPGPFEHSVSKRTILKDEKLVTERGFIEQIVRPTGLLDPEIEIRPTKNQLSYLISEIEKRTAKDQRVLITTLTKRLAEELCEWLSSKGIKVEYLHADIKTLERPEVLHRMRAGEIDVVVGINLLREGLDLPEVSLVAILDADQEGFLRNETTLIQTMGRAARHKEGRAILFADVITQSMRGAIYETQRRRHIQELWNRKHNILPRSIKKGLRPSTLISTQKEDDAGGVSANPKLIKQLQLEMREAVKKLDFEQAAKIRDLLKRLRTKAS